MKTLVLYDETGYIYLTQTGSYRIPQGGIDYLEVEIPDGKIAKSVDVSVTPHTPIYGDMPKSDVEILKEKQELMQKALDDVLLSGGAL
ncbi:MULTISPECIES: hypothetical protein [unclassified Clostridium]|uniref:hypothetical protein n=1 Tax=unclassified Clostridium TaxID=2614128 RepID=UPI0002978104|nr:MULTISPECIES: hypothetical protein [unclassified Clostridium]EKQ56257.1 MAG: hypothetical protein A370_02013 [Clostridium sp. Maddingley MBC34-26]